VKKPPLKDDSLFDDDDILGSMGLDSRKPTLLPSDSPPPETGGARSVLDSLLQGGSRAEKKPSQSRDDLMTSSLKMSGMAFSVTLLLRLLRLCHTGSVAEWLACRTQAWKSTGSNRSRDAVE